MCGGHAKFAISMSALVKNTFRQEEMVKEWVKCRRMEYEHFMSNTDLCVTHWHSYLAALPEDQFSL